MPMTRFSLFQTAKACFLAMEASAFFVCFAVMVLQSGMSGLFAGLLMWVYGQPLIVALSLAAVPIGALLRMILWLSFPNTPAVSLGVGALVGLVLAGLFMTQSPELLKDRNSLPLVLLGLLAGGVGGWTWWRIEKVHFDRLERTQAG